MRKAIAALVIGGVCVALGTIGEQPLAAIAVFVAATWGMGGKERG